MPTRKIFYFVILVVPIFTRSSCTSASNLDVNLAPLLDLFRKTNNIPTSIKKEDRLTTPELMRASGLDCEEVDVTTEDGFILKMFHIPAANRTQDLPIVLMHGLMDSSDTFCIRQRASLPFNLSESGYDVWLPNTRGNKYSRRHVTLDPDVDKEFWDWSFHENGYYDFPAVIDKVLEITGKSQVIIISHSQGPMDYLVMGSTRPEYNDKVKLSILLAPVYYLDELHGINRIGPPFGPVLWSLLKFLYTVTGDFEFLNHNCLIVKIIQEIGMAIPSKLARVIVFLILGSDAEQLEPDLIPVILGHYFSGTSWKTIVHYIQFLSKQYSQFNYGLVENLKKYNAPTAPLYDLTKVSSKVVIMVGENDLGATVDDSRGLKAIVPNSTFFVMPLKKFNHIDFVWGSEMSKYFFPYVHKFLNEFK